MSKRDEMIETLKTRLDEWNAEIDKLEARARQADADARSDYHRHIESLRSQRDTLRQRLEQLRTSSSAAWEDVLKGTESAAAALREGLDKARARFRR